LVFAVQKLLRSRAAAVRSTAKSGKGLASKAKPICFTRDWLDSGMIKMLLKSGPEETTPNHRAEPVEIWKTRKFIEERSGEELSLRTVAKAVNIHPNYLSEKFKHVTGMNFVEYVARTRFEKACRLLRDGDLRISDIAFSAGFQSLSQFNRVFKRLSGKSPTQFRAAKHVVRRNR
jgi:AraC-like DNA-binding protein